MFCTKCGKQNSDNTKFCVACGNSLKPASAPAPINEIKQEKVESPEAEKKGSGSFIFCTQCGKQNPSGTKFCITCGSPLQQSKNTAPVIQQEEKPKAADVNQSLKQEEPKIEVQNPEPEKKTFTPPATVDYPKENQKVNTQTFHPPPNPIAKPRKKKTGILIAIILLLLIGGAAGYWYYNEQQALKYFTRDYTGYINNSYVTVGIVRQGYVVSGTIKINNSNTAPVFLKGTVDSHGNYSLYSSEMSATFKGQFIGKTIMAGTASSRKANKSSTFNLISNSSQ